MSLLAAGFVMAFPNAAAIAQNGNIDPGEVVKVKLNKDLSSRTNRVGDEFSATVVAGQDDGGLPYGTKFQGIVRAVKRHYDKNPGVLEVDFTRIIFPNGDTRSISASLASLDNKSVSRNANGRLVSIGNAENDRLKWVGIGAGAGLLLSTLTKSDTLLTTILGAGLGYLYNETQNKKPGDVNLKAGTEFGIRMDRAFAFAPDNYRSYYRQQPADTYDYRDEDRASEPRPRRTDERSLEDIYGETRPGEDRYYRSRPLLTDTAREVRVMVDGREVRFTGSRPFTRGGAVMIPFAAVARSAGINYNWDSRNRIISVRGRDIRMTANDSFAMVDGREVRMNSRAEVRNGVLYVPMDFIAIAMDGDVSYDANAGIVEFDSREN